MTKWVAVYTKSRHEQIVVNELNKKNIEAYCPMFKERRQWSDRKKWVHFPLFRSYVFANIELKENIYVLQTIGVNKIVKFQGKISIIHDGIRINRVTFRSLIMGGILSPHYLIILREEKMIITDLSKAFFWVLVIGFCANVCGI